MEPAEVEGHSPARYAIVAVNAGPARPKRAHKVAPEDDEDEERPLDAFHYGIPPSLPDLQPGHLVWVPFGARYLQGVVMALDDHSPVEETRSIDRLADPDPIVSPNQLELARWISAYYMAPLQQVIWAMIPPGTTEQVEPVVEAMPDEPGTEQLAALTPGQREILRIVREHGSLPLEQVGRLTEIKSWRAMLLRLEDQGLILRRMVVSPPRVRPRFEDFCRLQPAASPDILAQAKTIKRNAVVAALERWVEQRADTHGWMPWSLLSRETGATRADLRWLSEHEIIEIEPRQVWRDPLAGKAFVPVTPPRLTPDQEAIWRTVAADLDAGAGTPYLLQGVTGSGKTELYLRAAQKVLSQGQGAIVLVPEIALTPQTIRRFGARHPDMIAVMHSGLTPGERYDQWRRVRAGELRLVVGARSAIFSPVPNLGLIVLDEEHEWTYKQDRAPMYHARDVALQLGRMTGATVILGSATPSLESAYRAERGQLVRVSLPKRIMGHRGSVDEQVAALAQQAPPDGSMLGYHPLSDDDQDALYTDLPPVRVVDLRQELRSGNASIFSRALEEALDSTLGAGQQAILFVNRRGTSSFVICRDCGYVMACRLCGLSLTYHGVEADLVCHRCNVHEPVPGLCPRCHSRRIRYFGLGTQRVEEELHSRYPEARVVRWDYDATRGRGAHEALLDRFSRGEADVMVGTQMVAKGLDLPRVTLVGVISADTLLNLPDLRASERTFQLLTQVAGRAGRSMLGGQVIIQTYAPEHPAIVAASAHDYELFYREEIAFRRKHWYPPISRIIRLLYVDADARQAERAAVELHGLLEQRIARLGLPDVDLIGPAPAFYERLRGEWRWHILVRGTDPAQLLRDVQLPPAWRIEVDPESLL
jgi:primosomal protein N' (replication factor Y)